MKSKTNSDLSRRRFLKGTAVAASSAFAVPTIIPRHVLGSPTAPGANDQIVVGIIGMGMRGDQLVMNVPESGRVAAICDADLRRTATATEKHGADWKIYQDYRKLIEQKDLDAVMVATVDHHHVLASMLACQTGKDVYCEKPLGLYVREGRALVQYALGMDETGPVEFWPVEEGPQARVDFRYANGVEVRLTFPDREPRRGPQLGAVFTGSECKIEINRNKFTTNPPDFITNPPDPRLAEKWEGDGLVAKGHVEHWFDCIRSREKPNADVEIGHRTASIAHLIVITRLLGRRLKWAPETETFPGDEEANALLDRPRRKGWELPKLS